MTRAIILNRAGLRTRKRRMKFKITAFLFLLASSAAAQSVTWTKVLTLPHAQQFDAYYNGYHDIHYDPFTAKTWIYSTSTVSGASDIYSARIAYFNSTNSTYTVLYDSLAQGTGGCVPQTSGWPALHHPVGQFWLDSIRHWFWSFEGTCGAYVAPEMWHLPLSNPISSCSPPGCMVQHFPPNIPIQTNYNGTGTVLGTGGITSAGQTSIPVNQSNLIKPNSYVKVSTEYILVTAGTGSATPTNVTGIRAQLGTSAISSALAGATVTPTQGQYNSGTVIHDTLHDVFIVFGAQQGGTRFLRIYCDASLNGNVLTANQIIAGCANPNDWTDIDANSQCADASCVNSGATPVSGANGFVPPGYYYPNMEWDSVRNQIVTFGGAQGLVTRNLTFTATVSTVSGHAVWTWTNKAPSCTGADCTGSPAAPPAQGFNIEGWRLNHAFNSIDGFYYLHATTHNCSLNCATSDWKYDPSGNAWTELGFATGPQFTETMTYDSGTNSLVAWALQTASPANGIAEIWVGQLTPVTLTVPLTIQESIYPGSTSGIDRTNEPFCQGVPIADSANITGTGSLGLTGASAGQFRMLGIWPSGHYKHIEVCGIVPTISAGGTASVVLNASGSGNFGGSNMATDNTPDANHIQIATGTATFTVKKANFNVIDTAVIGSTTIVASSAAATRGLVITGPVSPATSCGTCTTVYSSANDASSSTTIEKNGPVEVVLRSVFTYKDAGGNPYMQRTVREKFHKNRNDVRVTAVRRNANYDTSAVPSPDFAGSTFNTAYKGFQADEIRIVPSISQPLTWTIANDTGTPTTGTLTIGTDAVHLYQAQSNTMLSASAGGSQDYTNNANTGSSGSCALASACAATWTPDSGYVIIDQTGTRASGSTTQHPQGWCDIRNAAGVGIEIGIYQMSAYWPKSCDFLNGGTDVRIGLRPQWNSVPSYQPWPAWDIDPDVWLQFHTTAPSTTAMVNDFLAFQHPLVARATPAYYNSTAVFAPHTLIDSATEAAYYRGLQVSSSPSIPINRFLYQCPSGCTAIGADLVVPDRGTNIAGFNIIVPRWYNWPVGGAGNQEEFRWADDMRFLQGGQAGRFVASNQFYRWQAGNAWQHSDGVTSSDSTVNGFQWQNRPQAFQANPELDARGFLSILDGCIFNAPPVPSGGTCSTKIANYNKSFVSWYSDWLHAHWYGITDHYFLTGDETLREAMLPQKSVMLNPQTYQQGKQGGSVSPGDNCGNQAFCFTRAEGIFEMAAARFGTMLTATGDSDGANVLAAGTYVFNHFVKPDVCVPGPGGVGTLPTGCTLPPATTYATVDPQGISRVRGLHLSARNPGWCPKDNGSNSYRIAQVFQHSILGKGMREHRQAKGPAWADYELSGDLAALLWGGVKAEMFNWDGTNNWQSATANGLYNGTRFIMVSDIQNQCSVGLNQVATSGMATTNGCAVTWSSGQKFDNVAATDLIGINGTQLVVGSVTDNQHLTLSGNCAGVNTIPIPWARQLQQPAAAGIKAGNGFVNFTIPTATQISGPAYPADPGSPWDGLQCWIAGNACTVTAVPSTTTLTISGGVNNANAGFSINPKVYQIGSNTYDPGSLAQPNQGMWDVFSVMSEGTGDTSWKPLFDISMQQLAFRFGPVTAADFGTIDIWDDIAAVNGGGTSLQDIAFTFTDQGSGNYLIGYTPPVGATAARVKYSPVAAQAIQGDLTKLLNFNNWTGQTFGINPATNLPWFGANTTVEPAVTPGAAQSFVVNTTTLTGAPIAGLTKPNFSVKVLAAPLTLAVTTTTLPAATVGGAYSQTLQASGGTAPYTWTTTAITGAFCTGMTLSSAGVISIASVSGNSCTFSVRVTDFNAVTATSGSLTITVVQAPVITTTTLPDAFYGTPYSTTLSATGGVQPYSWSLTAGALPTGLSLVNQAGQVVQPNLSSPVGLIRGIPTQVGISGFTFTITVTGANGVSASKTWGNFPNPLMFNVNPAVLPAAPQNCINSSPKYIDPDVCQVPDEVPLNTFARPGVGNTYVDYNFGTTVKQLTAVGTVHAYAQPSAFSVNNTYALVIAAGGQGQIVNATTGAMVVAPMPSWSSPSYDSPTWDQNPANEGCIYGFESGVKLHRLCVGSPYTDVVLKDYTGIYTGLYNGGTGHMSLNGFKPFFSNDLPGLICVYDVPGNDTYCGDLQSSAATMNGTIPFTPINDGNGYVYVAPAVDSVSGKQYVFGVTACLTGGGCPAGSFSIWSVDKPNHRLNFEFRGPEDSFYHANNFQWDPTRTYGQVPANPNCSTSQSGCVIWNGIFYQSLQAGNLNHQPPNPTWWLQVGNNDGICEPNEFCLAGQHNDLAMINARGLGPELYVVGITAWERPVYGYTTSLAYRRVNAGPAMDKRLSEDPNGGRFDVYVTSGGNHVSCATRIGAEACSISGDTTVSRSSTDFTSPVVHTTHLAEVTAFRGLGTTARRLAYTRSIQWDGTQGYNAFARACLSADGTQIMWDSNVGHFLPGGSDKPSSSWTAPTGFGLTPLSITATTFASGTVGTAYSANIAGQANGGDPPYTFTVASGAIPTSLTLSSAGVISGTPSAAGTFNFTITVTDSFGATATSTTETIVINALVVPPSITSVLATTGTVGVPYSATLTGADGTPPYAWSISVGVLPTGLNLGPSTGAISGTPSTAGVFNFTAKLTDGALATATHAYTVTISPPPPSVTSVLVSSATTGVPYTGQLAGTGGTPPYTWAVTVGTLPTGLSLNGSTGAITGTPTVAATSNFTVRLTDNASVTATRAYSITVIAPPAPTNGTTVNGVVTCTGCKIN